MNADQLQAQWENELRRRLARIRDDAMELAALLEFSGDTHVEQHPVWQFATEIIKRAEHLTINAYGELEFPRHGQ